MSHNPDNLQYTASHEWVREEGDHTYTVGITDHAQGMLGDIVFVELPELETKLSAGEEVAVIESVKTAADIYAPLNGEVVAINEALVAQPDAVNRDPYGDGWLFQVKIDDAEQLENLLDVNGYEESISE